MSPATAVRDESAADQIIEAIKIGIRSAVYLPGQRLSEPDLMQAHGVSRGPVREALRRLSAEGLVKCERFHSAQVVRLSRREVRELGEIRCVLEGLASASVAARIDAEGRAAIGKVERLWSATKQTHPVPYAEYNAKFHDLLIRLSGNSNLYTFVERTKVSILRLQFQTLLLSVPQVKRSHTDHERIVTAVLQGNAKMAETEMRSHISRSTQSILDAPDYFFSEK